MNTIQSALRNVLSREGERLRGYDFSSEKLDDAMYIVIPGIVAGVCLTAMTIHAGGIAELPNYAANHLTTWKDQLVQFARNNETSLVGAGSVIAGAGALMFLKGLQEEHQELKDRWKLAFNPNGHGQQYIDAVSQATDKLLSAHKNITREVAREQQWARENIAGGKRTNTMILEAFGIKVDDEKRLTNLQNAYAFGVKTAFADALTNNRDIAGGFNRPNQFVEQSLIDGMTEYLRATTVNEPGLADKLKYVFYGADELLKERDTPFKAARTGLKAIKKLRASNPVDPSEGFEP